MGATASSAQRDSRDDEDAAAEQRTAETSDAPEDDTLPQRNGQISSLNLKTKNHADEINGHLTERILTDVCSGFVTVKEDGRETIKDLQDVVSHQPNTNKTTKNKSREMIHEEDITLTEETMEITEVNSINEVGFKKVFRFVGFKFTLKKDACDKTDGERLLANEKEGDTSEDYNDLVSAQPKTPETTQKTKNKTELDQATGMIKVTPEKEKANVVEASYESEEPMSPIKQFFTQGIFGSLRKKKKENEIERETNEEGLRIIDQIDCVDSEKSERTEKVDSKCMCLDIPSIMYEEEKDAQQKSNTLLPEEESLEKDKVQGSPFKRLFRKFSSRRQRENKHVKIEDEEKVTESSLDLTEVQKEEEPVPGEPKPAVEQVADASPQESKKKSDSTVSWEALICGSSAKKRARQTNEAETQDEYGKTTESPLGSSAEGDYDHLTSSNEQDGEGESTWKTFKKMVTPKRKMRTGEGSSSEHEPSDSEINKDDSFSVMKLITGCKKRRSDERQEQTSSDETGKDAETGDEDDETPAIIPLSEYEIVDTESVKEVNDQQSEATSEHEMPELNSQELEQETPNESEPKQVAGKVSNNARPLIIHVRSEDFEELTDFVSKHQQLSDIPEEGIIEESIQTPTTSAEWVTQDDTLAEDIVDLTADAVTAPEPASEEFVGDNSTEMVSALSQLTESARTSGNVTPVSAEYGVQMSNMIFQEGLQSICMTPSVQSVTTKDESQESLAVSFSPYIIHTTTGRETKVLVAHMRTEASAICTGLISQEIESVEELLNAPLVEAIPEVSDAVPTELVSDNLTDAPEVAGFGTDEVYEAQIWEVKTECREVIITTTNEVEEAVTETELDVEQAIQLMAEPLTEVTVESHVVHMVDEKEECITELVTGVQLRTAELPIIDTMQSEAVLDQVISEYTLGPETEGPLHLRLEEQPVNYTEVTAKVEKESTGEKVNIEEFELIHTDEHEIQVDIKDAIPDTAETEINYMHEVISSGDSAVIMKDINEKVEDTIEEKIVQQDIKDITAEQSINVVALRVDRNIETEHISETAVESLSRVQFEEKQLEMASKEVLLPGIVLVEETVEVDEVTTELDMSSNKVDTDVDNIRVMESAREEADTIDTSKKEKLAEKQEDQFTNSESDDSENQEVFAYANICTVFPEMIEQDVGIVNVETAQAFKAKYVSEISMDVLENKEITAYPGARSKVILTDLESVMPQDKTREAETEEIGHSPETTKKVKTGEVLETVVITENTTNQSEKPVEVQLEVQALAISELTRTTEQEDTSTMPLISGEAMGGDQMDQARVQSVTIAIPEIKEKIPDVTKLEPESPKPTLTEVTVTALTESVQMAQNNAALQMDNNTVIEQRDGATEKTRFTCEPPEQLLEKLVAVELIEKAEMKPAVIYLKEEKSAVTTPELAPIVQVPLLTSEMKTETPEVTASEIQTQAAIKLRAATLEMTDPKQEMPMVAEVKIETQLSVETPVVTSVVTELEVETQGVASMAKTVDTPTSAITTLNKMTDTSRLTTMVRKQEVDLPTLMVTSAAAPGLLTPVVILDSMSAEETSVVTLMEEALPVDPVANTVVEMHNVITVVETPNIPTEAAPTVDTTTGTTVAAETSVHSFTTVKLTEALVAQTSAVPPVLEMPNLVVQTPVLDSVVVTPALAPAVETQAVVLVTEAEPSVAVTPGETSAVSPVVETPVTSITSPKPTVAAMAQTLVVTLVEETTALVSDTALETEVVGPVSGMFSVSPEEETSCMTQMVETPDLDSVMVTQPASQLVTPDVTTRAETSVLSPVTKTSAVAVAETPVVLTPALVSVIVREAAPPEVTPKMTAVVEVSAVDLVVETTSTLSVTADTPVMIPEKTLTLVSVEKTLDVTPPVETPVVGGLIGTSARTSVLEAPQVTPAVEIPAIASVVVTPDVMATVNETMLQDKTETEPSVEAEDDVKPSLLNEKEVKTLVLPEEAKGFLQHEAPMVTPTEPQSVVEDVWEDAVENVGDGHCQMMQTDVSPQEVSDSGI
nr:A-kinase anchor protein 12 [Misgurnus anguillicaudatus]